MVEVVLQVNVLTVATAARAAAAVVEVGTYMPHPLSLTQLTYTVSGTAIYR